MFSNCIWSTFDLVTLFFRNRIIGNFFFQVYGLKIGVFLPTDFFVTYCICTVGLWNGFAITRAWTEKVHNGLKIKILSMNEHSNFHNKMRWAMEQLAKRPNPAYNQRLIFEKLSLKNQVGWTWFFVYFQLDFYCLCSLQSSSLK